MTLEVAAEAVSSGGLVDDDEDEVENRLLSSAATRDPDACVIKVRFDGKNKIHELTLRADDPLSAVLDQLSIDGSDEIQITCVAKRLTISSADPDRMQQSLRSLGLSPSSYLVVSIGDRVRSKSARATSDEVPPSLSERAATKKKQRKRGSHTMQSVGIYAKDDNNKAELIDGGGGVWYEHDVSDDEQEEEKSEEPVPQAAEQEPPKESENDDEEDDDEEEEEEVGDFNDESEEKGESSSSDYSDEGQDL